MVVNIIEVQQYMNSFTMFQKPDLGLLKETKKINVSFHHHTKTRISTSIQIGQFKAKVNFPIEGYKNHCEREMNYFSGTTEISHYFVKSKKQNFESYKQYLTKLIPMVITDYFKLEMDEINIILELRDF